VSLLQINKLKETIAAYVKIKLELFKLDITAHLLKILAQVIAYLIIFIMAVLVFAFAGVALANYLNSVFENTYGGYLVIAGFFLILLFIVLYLLQSGKLKTFLESKMVDSNSENTKIENPEENA
jgi:hypothetical protein